MRHIFFLPGILGTELKLDGNTVWPPPICKLYTDAEVDQLLDTKVKAGDIIKRLFLVHPVYSPILDSLKGAIAGHSTDRLVEWPYDWRLDLIETSARLADDLKKIMQTDPDPEVVLIAHSMGGLIVRGALEDPANANEFWQEKIKLAIFLATPHDGAIDAITEVSGIDGVGGLTKAQSLRLNSNDDYPAAYQLIPPLNTPSIWGAASELPLAFDSQETWGSLGLRWSARDKLDAFRKLLNFASKPEARRYVSVVSAAMATKVRMLPTGGTPGWEGHKDPTSGDGTVPIESATALRCQTLFVSADHVGVAGAEDTLAFVNQLLGLTPNKWAFQFAVPVAAKLSISPKFITVGGDWEILIQPGSGGGLSGVIGIQQWEGNATGDDIVPIGPEQTFPISVTASGQKSLTLSGPALKDGQYKIQFRPNGGVPSATQFLIVRPDQS